MKTNLPKEITTVEQAKLFLTELYKNGEQFHPEDNAHDVIFELPQEQMPTKKECDHLNKLMQDIYDLPGNKDKYPNLALDPCEVIMNLFEADQKKRRLTHQKGQSKKIMQVEVYGEVD